jgi:hypothetical protein
MTPSEVLLQCLEQFGESEPRSVVVLWVAEDTTLRYVTSCAESTSLLGMLHGVVALVTYNLTHPGKWLGAKE